MEDKVINFISNLNGQFVEVSSKSALYQCMDLAYLWVFVLGFPKSTIQQGTASEVWTNANEVTRQYFELIPNTKEFIAKAGDIFVITKNSAYPYGHIGIVVEGTLNRLKRFEQNFPTGTNAHIEDRTYANITGFLRPKNVIIAGVPQWLNTLLQEINLNIQNESEIRVIFDKAKRYDDEVKVLKSQVVSANETLADKALEVSSLTSKNESLTSQVDDLNKLYTNAKSERDTFSWENDKIKIENESLKEAVTTKETQINDLKKELETLQRESINGLSFWTLIKLAFTRNKGA
jgi:cell division protein FtsB